jgi:hypothetical protein
MMTKNHDVDLLMQPNKRPYFGPEVRTESCLKDADGVASHALSFTSPTKRTRTDGSIAVCDKQPRVHEVLLNSVNGEDVHSIYYEINSFLGELHFQRQVRELRNRLAAQQSPSKLTASS